ncbi:TlpA family protein disulfide reductase [Patescibacteria group bacterium]|nr:TlpA family protein disulfide reductase [Patescibacteria group bacterium]
MKIKYKIILLILLLLVVVFIFILKNSTTLTEQSKQEEIGVLEKPVIGWLAPDFILENPAGLKMNLSMFRQEKPVLLLFWSTTCPFCIKELPSLKKLNKEYKNSIQIIAIVGGESKEKIQKYIKDNNINFFISVDLMGNVSKYYSVRGTPEHILIDMTGKIINRFQGAVELNQLKAFIEPVLK